MLGLLQRFTWNNKQTKWHTFYSITVTSSPSTAMLSWQPITYKPIKLGQTDLVWVCDQSASVGMCMQHYKSLCVAVMTCASLVNTQTHTAFDHIISSAKTLWQKVQIPTTFFVAALIWETDWLRKGLTYHQTRRSYRGWVLMGQMTQPTVSKHWRKTGARFSKKS